MVSGTAGDTSLSKNWNKEASTDSLRVLDCAALLAQSLGCRGCTLPSFRRTNSFRGENNILRALFRHEDARASVLSARSGWWGLLGTPSRSQQSLVEGESTRELRLLPLSESRKLTPRIKEGDDDEVDCFDLSDFSLMLPLGRRLLPMGRLGADIRRGRLEVLGAPFSRFQSLVEGESTRKLRWLPLSSSRDPPPRNKDGFVVLSLVDFEGYDDDDDDDEGDSFDLSDFSLMLPLGRRLLPLGRRCASFALAESTAAREDTLGDMGPLCLL